MEKVERSEHRSFRWRPANPLQFASGWMPNGTLTGYINKNPLANRIDLVSLCPAIILPRLSTMLISSAARCCRRLRLSSRKSYYKQRLERRRCSLRIIWTAFLILYQSNVLFDRSDHARLADFGFSTVCGLNPILVTDAQGYTPWWATPKALAQAIKYMSSRLFLWHGVDNGQSLVSLFPASGAGTEGSADIYILC